MDEFLALMEDDGESASPLMEDDGHFLLEEESSVVHGKSSRGLTASPNHFLYSVNDEKKKKIATPSTAIESRSIRLQSEKVSPQTNVATVGVDEKLGIRMINRNVSSLDLLDMITSTSPYFSPAQISAMSSQALCRLLVDPPTIVDRATVQGRTQLVTVGIVFENSGTKTSSKGGAFCILTVGSNLQTGPCISVFLFGSAYTKFCRSCQAGQVVAISNPKLLPVRDDNGRQDTSVSFSVYDQSQVIDVAKARDYGICQGTNRAKQANGTWSDTAGSCKSYVDKRSGDFCSFHAKQQKQKNTAHMSNCSQMRGVGGVSRCGSGLKMIQEHKAKKMQQIVPPRNAMTLNRFLGPASTNAVGNIRTATPINLSKTVGNRFLGNNVSSSKAASVPTNPLRSSSATFQNTVNPYVATSLNRDVPATRGGSASTVPVHMKKQDRRDTLQSQSMTKVLSRNTPRLSNKVGGDWMEEAVSKRTPAPQSLTKSTAVRDQQRTRKISTVGGGFDGSVAVPKPSPLFQNKAATISAIMSASLPAHGNTMEEVDKDKIKEKQALLAERLREKQMAGSLQHEGFTNATASLNGKKQKKSSSSGNVFLDSIHVDNVEAVLAAKSQFAHEADAEEYAKNRSRIVELEKIETKQTKRKGPTKENENQKIICEWVCRTCPNAPRFSMRPTQCISSGHQVKRERMLKQSKTKDDERLQLNAKAAENGGIVLGRGLEWSSNRFNQVY